MEFSSLYFNISPQKKSHVPNVISIKPDRLVTATNATTTTTTTVTGASSSQSNKLVYCKTCQAVLTCESQVFHVDKNNNNKDENKFVWGCEFCGFENPLVEAPATNELPGNDVNILLNNNNNDGSSCQDAGYFIFCVDVSKSMSEKSDVGILGDSFSNRLKSESK